MNYISGTSRTQLQFNTLEDFISADNPVRFVDSFVDHLDLLKLNFAISNPNKEGRRSFEPKLFLKIYLYGYLNGIRSSRKLERECERNIELHWLTNTLQPNYHSIADFRKINPAALKNVFKLFVSFLKHSDLIGGETIAIDGTKTRAHNSKKNNYNPKKIERHLKYIEDKSTEYLKQLEENDTKDDEVKVTQIKEKLERLKTNKIAYELLEKKLEESGEPQISMTDPDARALLVQGQVVEVCYNMQAAVDEKHKLVIATHTINRNDRNALTAIAKEAQTNIDTEGFTVLVDKGYHNGREIQQCTDAKIITIVAQQEIVNPNEKGTTPDYLVTKFIYNKEADTYTCPQGETLHTKGTWHSKKMNDRVMYKFKKYRTPKCSVCPVKHLCTGKTVGGRELDRSEYADAVAANNKRYYENQTLYRKRQEINEHIFGTIKRQWGYNHTNLNGLRKVNGEHSLIMLVYNIKRCINILGMQDLLAKLKNWQPDYRKFAGTLSKWLHLKPHYGTLFYINKLAA